MRSYSPDKNNVNRASPRHDKLYGVQEQAVVCSIRISG